MKVPTQNLVWGFEVERAALARTRREMLFAFGLATLVMVLAVLGKDWLVFLGLSLTSFALASAYVAMRRAQVRTELLAQETYALQAISFLNFRYPVQFGRWAILPDLAQILVGLMEGRKPQIILELGCGVSTLILAYARQALNLGCQIIVIESEEWMAQQVRDLLWRHGVGDATIRFIVVPLVEQTLHDETYRWFDLASVWDTLPKADLLLVDAPPGRLQRHSRYPAMILLAKKLNPRAVVVLDDGYRDDEQWIAREWSKLFPDFEATFLPTLKGCWLWTSKLSD